MSSSGKNTWFFFLLGPPLPLPTLPGEGAEEETLGVDVAVVRVVLGDVLASKVT
jgi:hypothetical protein